MAIFSYIPLILLAGTRINTGADYVQYEWNFDRLFHSNDFVNDLKNSREPLYILSELLVIKVLKSEYTTWVFIMALATICVLIWAILRIDSSIDLALFGIIFGFYSYFHMFNYVRQIFALSLIVLAFSFLFENNNKGFIITLVLATLFHQSSILFFGVYFLFKKREIIFGKTYYLYIVLSPFLLGGLATILKHIPFFATYYERYFGKSIKLGIGWLIDIIPAMILYFLIYLTKFEKKDGVLLFLCNVSLLIIPIRALSYYSYAAGRLFIDFSVFIIIAFCSLISNHKNKWIISSVAVMVSFVYFYYSFYVMGNSEVFPYTSTIIK